MGTQFRWLPNALSASRGILALPIYLSAANGHWVLGFILIIIALMTDFLDGLAAKKLQAESTLGGHIDRVADYLLCLGGGFGLVLHAHVLGLWLLWIVVPLSAYIGYTKFFLPEDSRLRQATAILSLTLLFITWSLIVWGYLWQAFGWSWWYVVFTFVVIAVAARLKKHRLRAWFGWLVLSQKAAPSAKP